MGIRTPSNLCTLFGGLVATVALLGSVTGAAAQQTYIYDEKGFRQGALEDGKIKSRTTLRAEQYIPTIWIDPDGCEHWVMDDGFEGFMTPHVTRNGKPVCRTGNSCGAFSSDQLFATNQATLSASSKAKLQEFFTSANGYSSFSIEGHTDSRASDAYNLRLSKARASAVAAVAQDAGVKVASVRGYGERVPVASNRTQRGRAANRRVEIQCIR